MGDAARRVASHQPRYCDRRSAGAMLFGERQTRATKRLVIGLKIIEATVSSSVFWSLISVDWQNWNDHFRATRLAMRHARCPYTIADPSGGASILIDEELALAVGVSQTVIIELCCGICHQPPEFKHKTIGPRRSAGAILGCRWRFVELVLGKIARHWIRQFLVRARLVAIRNALVEANVSSIITRTRRSGDRLLSLSSGDRISSESVAVRHASACFTRCRPSRDIG